MKSQPQNSLFFIFLLVGIGFFILLDLWLGSVLIPLKEFFSTLFIPSEHADWQFIVWDVRFPRVLTAVLTGAGLSVAGLMMQTLFRNPLAGPYVLGISSGASLGVALLLLISGIGGAGLASLAGFSHLGLVGASVLGSVGVMFLVILVSLRVRDSVSVLIIGIMFGSITGAVVSVLQYFSDPDSVHSFLVWTFGSLSDITWSKLLVFAPVVLAALLLSLGMHKPLNAFLLGENYAKGVGMEVRQNRLIVIVLTGIIAGGLTAFTGPIAFIGVAVPHIARSILKTAAHQVLMPAVMGIGAILMLICDLLSQLPGSSQVLPINSVTALFGAPVVIWVIVRRKM